MAARVMPGDPEKNLQDPPKPPAQTVVNPLGEWFQPAILGIMGVPGFFQMGNGLLSLIDML